MALMFCYINIVKKLKKTPKREIKKAKQERKEYLQKKEKENENME